MNGQLQTVIECGYCGRHCDTRDEFDTHEPCRTKRAAARNGAAIRAARDRVVEAAIHFENRSKALRESPVLGYEERFLEKRSARNKLSEAVAAYLALLSTNPTTDHNAATNATNTEED